MGKAKSPYTFLAATANVFRKMHRESYFIKHFGPILLTHPFFLPQIFHRMYM